MHRFTAIMALLAWSAALVAPADAQDTRFDSADGLYAAYELSQGGRPLYAKLFANGWPTDDEYVALTQRIGAETSDLLVSVYLASKAGLPLRVSDFQLARTQAQEKAGRKPGTPADVLSKDLRLYRALSGYHPSVRGLQPIFLPVRRAKANLVRAWNKEDLESWGWKKPDDQIYTLKGLGFALLAESAFVREQLSVKRVEEQQGRKVKLLGRSPRDGFMALVALHSASAKIHALGHQLLLDFGERRLIGKSSLLGVDPKAVAFPQAWSAEGDGTAALTLAKVDDHLKSRLGAQAAVLLGVCELASLCGPDASADLKALFAKRTIEKQTVTLFPRKLATDTVKVALFAFRSMAKLHVSVRGRGRASSVADRYDRGGTITPVDLGLYLMSLEAFLSKVRFSAKPVRSDGLDKQLAAEHKRALTLISSLSGVIRTWQQDQPGFYDSYSVESSSRQKKTKSLASQGFAIRGLLATHRALGGDAESPHLKAAKKAVQWLDSELWDSKAQAYLESGPKGGRRAPLFGSAAVLGALREMALETQDGRYLVRYKQFLESLERNGMIREATGSIAPGLAPETKF
jgi:hypothetical protein